MPTPEANLLFQAFLIVTADVAGLPTEQIGLVPHSSPNYAVTSNQGTTTSGQALVSTNYEGSTAKEVDLYSFYFGCSVNVDNPAGNPPQACSVTVTGYKGSDNTVANSQEVVAQTFEYNPTTALGLQQLAFTGSLNPLFKGLQFFTFQFQTEDVVLNADLALALDDVSVQVRGCNT